MTTSQPPPEAFRIRESLALEALTESSLDADGTVTLMVIRPSVGQGKGRHLYTPEMLRENAHKFSGWRMFKNHLSEQARRALQGLPRPIEHIGGRVLESWWDETVPAEGRFEQGAVMARVRPVLEAKKLIEEDPALLEASINARATAVRPVTRDGQKVWLVEGIEDDGSIDWVTEAGAGGRVASLIESIYHQQEELDVAMLESLTDEELVRHLRESRPGIVEDLAGRQPEKPETTPKEDEMTDPVKVLQEALQDDDGKAALRDLVESFVGDRVDERVDELLEARLEEALKDERDTIRAEARADFDRQMELRDLRDSAHQLIEAAELPPRATTSLKDEFALSETGPSSALDVFDEIGDDGETTKEAATLIAEAVDQRIKDKREELRESAEPTRVRGQGAGGDDEHKPSKQREPLWKRQLQEAKIDVAPDPAPTA